MVIGEMYRHFQGEFLVEGRGLGKEFMRRELSMQEFVMVEENFHEGAQYF